LDGFDRTSVTLPNVPASDPFQILENQDDLKAIRLAVEVEDRTVSDSDVQKLVAFLETLRDEEAIKGRLGVPAAVPSGLPVDH
jgi:cytochrome c peroxidase